jgi:AAA15 family ATPase/GTPase
MLKRIYIDNFRCLVNFELQVDAINLFLGSNGTGKSTVFEVLQKIQFLISGDSKIETIFKSKDCTRWQTSKIQRFELEILSNDGIYKYELGINHENLDKCRVEFERLWFDNQLLLKFESGNVEIFKDNYTRESQYSFNWSQSVLPSLLPKADNSKIIWFKERMARFIIVRVIPSLMHSESHQEETHLTSQMENYVSWYRYLSEDQGKVAELWSILKEVLEGFKSFKFERVSEQSLVLKLRFSLFR